MLYSMIMKFHKVVEATVRNACICENMNQILGGDKVCHKILGSDERDYLHVYYTIKILL